MKNRPPRVSDGKPRSASDIGADPFAVEAERTHRLIAVKARERLISVLMHDLRSPLNGIQGWAHVLESRVGSDSPLVSKALNGIRVAIDQQVQLMAAAKDALHILSGALNLEPTQVSLGAAVHAALANVTASATARALEFEQSATDAEVWVDQGRFTQALALILSHVVRSAGQLDTLRVDIRDEGSEVRLGIGMTPDVDDQRGSARAATTELALASQLLALNGATLRIVPLAQGSLREAFEMVLPAAARHPEGERHVVAARRHELVAARAEFEACLQNMQVAVIRGPDCELLVASLRALGLDPAVYAALADLPQVGVHVVLHPSESVSAGALEACATPCLLYGPAKRADAPAQSGALGIVPADAGPRALAVALATAARCA